jgi:hypothetical protein
MRRSPNRRPEPPGDIHLPNGEVAQLHHLDRVACVGGLIILCSPSCKDCRSWAELSLAPKVELDHPGRTSSFHIPRDTLYLRGGVFPLRHCSRLCCNRSTLLACHINLAAIRLCHQLAVQVRRSAPLVPSGAARPPTGGPGQLPHPGQRAGYYSSGTPQRSLPDAHTVGPATQVPHG